MNAARRAIVADLRMRGMTGKEAYEATKKPEFLKQWVRVQESRKTEVASPIPKVDPTWISRYLAKQLEKVIIGESKRQQKLRLKKIKDKFISKQLNRVGAKEALRLWEMELDRIQAEEQAKKVANEAAHPEPST